MALIKSLEECYSRQFRYGISFLSLSISDIPHLNKLISFYIYRNNVQHNNWWTKLEWSFFVFKFFNLLNANFTKWSNTLKQIVGNLPTNCLSVFDHFVGLALKG